LGFARLGEALQLLQTPLSQNRVRPIVHGIVGQLDRHAQVGQAVPQLIVGLQIGHQLGLRGLVQIVEDQCGQEFFCLFTVHT
jgi:hypothetical protein